MVIELVEERITSDDLKSLLERIGNEIYKKLSNVLEDITTLQVITVTGKEHVIRVKEKKDINGKTFVARRWTEITDENVIAKTIIEIDGDIVLKLPTDENDKVHINREIMELHEKNVKIAVENWRAFLSGIMEVCEGLIKFIK